MPTDPVETIPTDDPQRDVGARDGALPLGGGYRAMVFHVGVLWRLYEAGLLRDLKRISSVSGGSITAGVLALNWNRLSFDPARLRTISCPRSWRRSARLPARPSTPKPIIFGLALPGRISDRVAAAYDEHLFHGATLQDLPDEPRFVINATNVQSGALWRFMKPYMRDYRVGEVKAPDHPAGAGRRRVLGLSAGAVAVSRCGSIRTTLHAGLRPRPAARALHQPVVLLTDGGSTTTSASRRRGSAIRHVLVSDGGGKCRRRRSPRATGRSTPIACSTSSTTRCAPCASAR